MGKSFSFTSGTQVVDLIGNGCPIADYKAGLERFSGVGSAQLQSCKQRLLSGRHLGQTGQRPAIRSLYGLLMNTPELL